MAELYDASDEVGWLPLPQQFTHDGVHYEPTAVAMYGDMRDVVTYRSVAEGDSIWHQHVVLWATREDNDQ